VSFAQEAYARGKILPKRKPVLRSSTIVLLIESVGGNKKSMVRLYSPLTLSVVEGSKMSGNGNLMEKGLLYGKIITFKYLRLSTKNIILKLYYLVKEKNDC
jgi:hypothetical protein